jgi:hypothetical protein
MAKNNARWWHKTLLVLASHILGSSAGGSVGMTIWMRTMIQNHPHKAFFFPGMAWPLGVGDILFGIPYGGGLLLVVVLVIVSILSVIRFWRTQHKWYLLVFAIPALIFGVRGVKVMSEILAM